jgi:hypothetical protein
MARGLINVISDKARSGRDDDVQDWSVAINVLNDLDRELSCKRNPPNKRDEPSVKYDDHIG